MALESLDERIVPDAAVGTAPPPPPNQFAPQPAVATQVAVFPLVTEAGEFQNTYAILERVGTEYVVTQYDATTNTLYTGTTDVNTGVYLPGSPSLDALMQTYGMPRSLNNVGFVDANANYQLPSVMPGTLPPLGNPVPQPPLRIIIVTGGGVIILGPNTYPYDALLPYPPTSWAPNPYRPFPQPGGGPRAPGGPVVLPPNFVPRLIFPGFNPTVGPFWPNPLVPGTTPINPGPIPPIGIPPYGPTPGRFGGGS